MMKLTKVESKIYNMLVNEYLTPKQIANRRGTKVRTVYNIIKKLKMKGAITKKCTKSDALPALPMESIKGFRSENSEIFKGTYVRLHGEEWNIKYLDKGVKYANVLKKANTIFVDGTRVRLYSGSLEIYSGKYFVGQNVQAVQGKSLSYWTRFFGRLENDLGVVLIKPRKANVKLVKSHWAEVNNEYATELNRSGEKLKVFAGEDGKLAYLVDASLKSDEFEAVHPKTAKHDFERVKAHFKDVRENEHLALSVMTTMVSETIRNVQDISLGLKSVVDVLKILVPNGSQKEEQTRDVRLDEYIG